MATLFQRITDIPRRGLGAFVILLLFSLPAVSAVQLTFSVESIGDDDWQVEGIALAIASSSQTSLSLEIGIESLQLPEDHGTLLDLQLRCDASYAADHWRCKDGHLSLDGSPVGAQSARWSGFWQDGGAFSISIPSLRVVGGSLGLTIERRAATMQVEMQAYRLSVGGLQALFDLPRLPRDWNMQGRLSGNLDFHVIEAGSSSAKGEFVVDQVNYASPDGTQAAENVVLRIDLEGREGSSGWQFDTTWRWPKGALYSDPLFFDTAEGIVTLAVSGAWAGEGALLEIASGSVQFGDALSLSGAGRIDLASADIRELTIAAHSDNADRVYGLFVQPFLLGTPADDMWLSGSVGFVLHFDGAGIEQAGLTLNGLTLNDRKQRFALHSTTGSVAWRRAADGAVSTVSTEGVTLLGITSGAFDAQAQFTADRVVLLEPVVVPLLNGRIALDRFELSGALVDGAKPKWTASAAVHDVSLEQLTRELKWQPFKGSLTAVLTDMQYIDRTFSIGGELRLQAFDGDIQISDLNIREPLGAVPILTADATLRDLNLRALTETFAFGRIEGQLDGDLADLRLVAWQPDRFNLHLYTSPNAKMRRRISQRAVENLTELGSGIPAGLSASFLRIFKEFSYDAIDVRIELDGDTAAVGGLAREDGGYYLVRGSGLPRIDVIGRNRRVAWHDLVERLQKIQVEGATIE